MIKDIYDIVLGAFELHWKKVTGIVVLIVVILFFVFPSPSESVANIYFNKIKKYILNDDSVATCDSLSFSKLYRYGINSNERRYTNPPIKLVTEIKNIKLFNNIRENQTEKAFIKGDSLLEKNSLEPYAQSLVMPLIRNPNEENNDILNSLLSKKIIYINESVSQKDNICSYEISISMAKEKLQNVENLITLIKHKDCIDKEIRKEIILPLKEKNNVKVSISNIFVSICNSCKEINKVQKMINKCNGEIYNCKYTYFSSGSYELTDVSKSILESIASNLNKEPNLSNIEIEFHGYTDWRNIPSPILYTGQGYYNESFSMLDQHKESLNGKKIELIDSNLKLSFARAYSCFDYFSKFYNRTKSVLKYTGHGVKTSNLVNDQESRMVEISITK